MERNDRSDGQRLNPDGRFKSKKASRAIRNESPFRVIKIFIDVESFQNDMIMKQHQKIATLVLRLASTLVILFGTAYFSTVVLHRFTSDESEYYGSFFTPTVKALLLNGCQYIVIGIVIFLLSNPIGKIAARGLDD
jgi:hypothetical protein